MPFVLHSFLSRHAYFSYLFYFYCVFHVIFLSLPISFFLSLYLSPVPNLYAISYRLPAIVPSNNILYISHFRGQSPFDSFHFYDFRLPSLFLSVFFFFRLPSMLRAVEGSFEVTWLAGGCAGSFHVRFPLPFLPKSRSPRGRNRIINYSPY